MGSKLYPPYIDGKIPAFCGTELKVPFRHNRAVAYGSNSTQVKSIACKMKTVSTNEWVWTLMEPYNEAVQIDHTTGMWTAVFNLDKKIYEDKDDTYFSKLIEGVYYKIQIAYVDSLGTIGYFSDVGVTKYTTAPTLKIENLQAGEISAGLYNYVGVYSQENKDVSEKEYSYCFTILNEDGSVFDTSGVQIHNAATDTEPYESSDTYICRKDLISNRKYTINYAVTTLNNLTASSPVYTIMRKDSVRPSVKATLHAESNFDEGYIGLLLIAQDDKYYSGNFTISRASSKDNFELWDEICHFTLERETPLRDLFKDFTVEQGVRYCYSLLQYNSRGLYSNRMKSETVTADFEDMFLFDGFRQLKVRFNPTVASFKNDILESKTDTIGSKYPFIFRNGNVKYKEFPIGGLISYLMDDQAFFLSKDSLGALEFEGTDLTSENIRAERIFKLEVMEWLSDGLPKLFKSPTEGNYIVRLLNSSLSANTVTGRMLHSFTATAYEIAELTFDNLLRYNLITVPEYTDTNLHFATVQLAGYMDNDNMVYYTANSDLKIPSAVYLGIFEDVEPGTLLELTLLTGQVQLIEIGATYIYKINTLDNPVTNVKLISTPNQNAHFDGTFTYGYYEQTFADDFNEISDFEPEDELWQFVGYHEDIVAEVEDLKRSIGRFYLIKVNNREIAEVFHSIDTENANQPYIYGDVARLVGTEILAELIVASKVYKIVDYEYTNEAGSTLFGLYVNGFDLIEYLNYREANEDATTYWTELIDKGWYEQDCDYFFWINHPDQNVNLESIGRYIFNNLDTVSKMKLGNMLMADCYILLVEIKYAVENSDPLVAQGTTLYIQAKENYEQMIADATVVDQQKPYSLTVLTQQDINNAYELMQTQRTQLIGLIKNAIEKEV